MSFLGFRKRKAKKIVSIRSPRPPTPPSPTSFVSAAVVEIGDPSRPSAEAYLGPLTLHLDLGVKAEPFLPSDHFLSPTHEPSLTASSRQAQDRRARLCSKSGGSPPKSLHDGTGSVRSRDGRVLEVEDATRAPSRRATKVPPAPIKIPPAAHAPRIQIQRSAGKSAELRPISTNPRESPVVDDTSSVVSGITLPGALIANLWTLQPDQLHHQPSRRITRIDSAILPVGDNTFTQSLMRQYSRTSNGDGEPLVPPLPALPAGIDGVTTGLRTSEQSKGDVILLDNVQTTRESNSRDQLPLETTTSESVGSPSKPPQISPTEESTTELSDTGTPDLIKDSATSAEGGSSDTQPDSSSSSDSAPSAWRLPVSRLTPASGEELIRVLNFFPTPPSDRELPIEPGVLMNEHNLDEAACSHTLLIEQRRTCAAPEVRRRPHSRSSARPSPVSVNTLLHPATLFPVGERWRSSIRSPRVSAAGSRAVAPDDSDNLSAMPSSLPVTLSQCISRVPSFPESAIRSSALRSSGFPNSLKTSSPPPSPDLLDHIVLADGSGARRRERSDSHGSSSTMPASVSANRQTFPETPSAFSPMFSPGVDHSRAHKSMLPESEIRRHTTVTRSLRGCGARASQRFIVGRSASTRSPVRMNSHKKSSSKLSRPPTRNSITPMPSPRSTATKGDVPTMPDQARLGDDLPTRPRSLADHSPGVAHSRRLTLRTRSGSWKKTSIRSVPFVLPSSPPSKPPSPQKAAIESRRSPASPSIFSLPPPPPPPKLHPPPPPGLPAPSPQPARPCSSDVPPADEPQVLDVDRFLPPPPSSPPPVTPPSEVLAAPPVSLGHAPVDHLLNTNNTDRPPRPLGPRAPYRTSSSPGSRETSVPSPTRDTFPGGAFMGARDHMTGGPGGSSSGPKFLTSPQKFKGLTLEAAKWTLSGEELQEIVSQAIRESGQASSIRLLPLEARLVEIPDELERLNTSLQELRVQYRLQVRKRDALMRATFAYAGSPEFSSIALRSKLQELRETAVTLDRIAEELYSVRDQVAQLSRMLAVHSGSALAMALRKLHSSYLKRKAELQSLTDHVHTLETERDEAWTQAQQVARDLDDLNDALQNQDSSPSVTRSTSRRSSRAIASRKSYQHVSRTGLRVSMASHVGSAVCTPSSTSGPIPPVPPIPRRPSLNHIITSGLPSQLSASISNPSASSARRALTRAEADLYGYLGIDNADLMPLPRRSSIAVSPSTRSPLTRDMAPRRMSDITDSRLTRGCDLSDRFQASMENEADALLNTFNHLDP